MTDLDPGFRRGDDFLRVRQYYASINKLIVPARRQEKRKVNDNLSKKKKKAGFRRVIVWGLKLFFVLLTLSMLQVLALRFINPPFTTMIVWDWIQQKDTIRLDMLRNLWRPLKDISPYLRKAVLAGEDQRFLVHHGFDFTEMNKAIKDMILRKGYRGASTITMQVARTVFLWPERSWLRKAVESYYTVIIELFWSKERVLEIYLNTVDWGAGIIGSEAASRKYFHISCSRISRSQASLLAAILPAPHKWSPTNPNEQVLARQKRILKDMEKMPLLS